MSKSAHLLKTIAKIINSAARAAKLGEKFASSLLACVWAAGGAVGQTARRTSARRVATSGPLREPVGRRKALAEAVATASERAPRVNGVEPTRSAVQLQWRRHWPAPGAAHPAPVRRARSVRRSGSFGATITANVRRLVSSVAQRGRPHGG